MKKAVICGLLLASSLSFQVNAGILDGVQELYIDLKVWVSHATKPRGGHW